MVNPSKLDQILTLGREANQQCFSQLSDLHKQAVMILGEQFPAKLEAGKLVYDRDAKQSSLAGSYIKLRQAIKMSPGVHKGYTANTMQVFMDTPWPEFEETSWEDAINSFPSNKVPEKDCKFSHLPLILPDEVSANKAPNIIDIARALAEITVRINRGMEMPKNLDAIHKMCIIRHETFESITTSIGLKSTYTHMMNNQPQKYVAATVEHEGRMIDIKKFKLPAGTIPFENFQGSYLANYITQAYRGLYLKAEIEL